MREVIRVKTGNKNKKIKEEKALMEQFEARSSRVALIQELIPIGLMALEDELQREVVELAGPRYSHGGDIKRWGTNRGFAYLGEQRHAVQVPRLRDMKQRKFISLESYQEFQNPRRLDEAALNRVLHGISTRSYEKAAFCVGEPFGLRRSNVSRRFIKESAAKLKELNERDLSSEEIIAIFLDGKRFAKAGIMIALGVTLSGKKIVLGIIESATEHHQVCEDFLNNLITRGLKVDDEILFIIDGAKGLSKGIKAVLKNKAIIQRCQWHKRENVVAYLSKAEQPRFRVRLQKAYDRPTYEEAKGEIKKLLKELKDSNQSAAASLEEGLEETLTLHKLGMFAKLGRSFKTTNCIESLNAQLEQYTYRVDYWKNSDQRQRWIATSLLEIEPKLRKVMGHKHLPELRKQMKNFNPKS